MRKPNHLKRQDDFAAGHYSGERGHPEPGDWATPEFRRGWYVAARTWDSVKAYQGANHG